VLRLFVVVRSYLGFYDVWNKYTIEKIVLDRNLKISYNIFSISRRAL